MIEGENQNQIYQLIYETSQELKIEYLFESIRKQEKEI